MIGRSSVRAAWRHWRIAKSWRWCCIAWARTWLISSRGTWGGNIAVGWRRRRLVWRVVLGVVHTARSVRSVRSTRALLCCAIARSSWVIVGAWRGLVKVVVVKVARFSARSVGHSWIPSATAARSPRPVPVPMAGSHAAIVGSAAAIVQWGLAAIHRGPRARSTIHRGA